ncbi:hypothetical protein B23_1955 [Geobacillus thermoleovorans B23]|nr:hypothetical protein B23_1955 [Geobacillus thermoleovorans B23]
MDHRTDRTLSEHKVLHPSFDHLTKKPSNALGPSLSH